MFYKYSKSNECLLSPVSTSLGESLKKREKKKDTEKDQNDKSYKVLSV